MRLARGESMYREKKVMDEICGIRDQGEEEARRTQLRNCSEKWPALHHTRVRCPGSHVETKVYQRRAGGQLCPNADIR